MDNPFEIEKLKEPEEKKIERKINVLVEQAQKLLNNPDYTKYKKLYFAFRDVVYKRLQECPETDAQKFTVESKVWLAKLSVLQLLIDEVESDVAKTKRRKSK